MLRDINYIYSKVLKKYLRGKAIKNSYIDKTAYICSGCQVINSSIGKYSNIGYDCQIIDCAIGNFCSIATNVVIGSAEHPMHWVSISPVFEDVKHSGSSKRFSRHSVPPTKHTEIGHDVWIGYGVIIKAGVNIGNGAVIGSGAVVTKDVEPYSIVAGCPATPIRYRFDEEIRSELLKTQWWYLSDSDLRKIADTITNPQEFIRVFKELKMLK